mmetsp:Transcript_113596/g.367049  ORF Transcript_113596/g.367049 Transcript_113596/m.367049 type:complete len:373 (+) Transcript_113596:211-1329(+)
MPAALAKPSLKEARDVLGLEGGSCGGPWPFRICRKLRSIFHRSRRISADSSACASSCCTCSESCSSCRSTRAAAPPPKVPAGPQATVLVSPGCAADVSALLPLPSSCPGSWPLSCNGPRWCGADCCSSVILLMLSIRSEKLKPWRLAVTRSLARSTFSQRRSRALRRCSSQLSRCSMCCRTFCSSSMRARSDLAWSSRTAASVSCSWPTCSSSGSLGLAMDITAEPRLRGTISAWPPAPKSAPCRLLRRTAVDVEVCTKLLPPKVARLVTELPKALCGETAFAGTAPGNAGKPCCCGEGCWLSGSWPAMIALKRASCGLLLSSLSISSVCSAASWVLRTVVCIREMILSASVSFTSRKLSLALTYSAVRLTR